MKFKWQASLLHSREQKRFNEYATSVLRHLHAQHFKYSNYVNKDCTKYTFSLEKHPGFSQVSQKHSNILYFAPLNLLIIRKKLTQ